MSSTVIYSYNVPAAGGHRSPGPGEQELFARYEEIAWAEDLRWDTRYRKRRLLGAGGQGAVYLADRLGADGFIRPVALKVFSPESYHSSHAYQEDMVRVAQVNARVALIQSDNVVDIHDFIERNGVRIMEMEWLDGYDLREVLHQRMLELTREKVGVEQWQYVDRVILTSGPSQARLKPGVAIAVLRDCLAGLAALHGAGIVHGDLKPGNIMLTRTGSAKIIDIGSAIDLRRASPRRAWSPVYAAPEVLEGGDNTPRSDLASLGYVLVEMLAGRPMFEGLETYRELIEAKAVFDQRVPDLLPPEVSGNELLLNVCQQLIAPDPNRRFSSAQAADVGRKGAADFHRQLVKGNLASEYEHDIRAWLERLG
ncbi:MAG TPA: serine/threonine-protein kinase [Planctomycetaceae bacterium]|nr:serine/threonine-protein kinase [Planctomycetaceae bacterium]